jgi:hypothetical protein
MKHLLEIHRNAENSTLAYLSPLDENEELGSGCYRIAGPKAWGGSKLITKIKIDSSDIVRYIKGYAPDILEKLKGK